jgi:hypothetical protein
LANRRANHSIALEFPSGQVKIYQVGNFLIVEIQFFILQSKGGKGIERALHAGAWKLLCKPVDVPKLLKLMKEARRRTKTS